MTSTVANECYAELVGSHDNTLCWMLTVFLVFAAIAFKAVTRSAGHSKPSKLLWKTFVPLGPMIDVEIFTLGTEKNDISRRSNDSIDTDNGDMCLTSLNLR